MLYTENWSICHEVKAPNFKLAIHFTASIALLLHVLDSGKFYALGPFLWHQPHMTGVY